MKNFIIKHIEKFIVLIFLAIGLLFLFLLYKVATRPLHVIQENKYIDLKEYNYLTK